MIQSVDRALGILTVLQGARRMSLTEIATALGLSPPTVHGIIRTLLAHGMVQQERDSLRYRLGPATLRLGNVYLDTLELRSKAIPWAEDLARRTGLAVRVGVLLIDDVVIIHHEPRPDGSRQMPEVGIVIPAHASALGKAMLAFLPEDRLAPILDDLDLAERGPNTITDRAAFRTELAGIRETGIAVNDEELAYGLRSIAAPISARSGEVVASLNLAVHRSMGLTTDLIERFSPAILRTAAAISAEIP
jgi:DNA-binding IclR family transcriptional regulator